MKKKLIRLQIILTIVFLNLTTEGFGFLEKKLIGKINIGGDSDYILQLHVEDSEHIYSILDVKNGNSELSSFKLIFNDQTTFDQNFKKAINDISTLPESIKNQAIQESQQYFYALNVIKSALPQDENGPLAMTLKFENEATVRKVSYGKNNFVKKKELFNFLAENNIYNKKEIDKKLFSKNPEEYLVRITPTMAINNFSSGLYLHFSENEVKKILQHQTAQGSNNYFNKNLDSLYKEFYNETVKNQKKIKNSNITNPNKIKESLANFQNYLKNSKHIAHYILSNQITENKKEIELTEKETKLNNEDNLNIQKEIIQIKEIVDPIERRIRTTLYESVDLYEKINEDIDFLNFEIESYESFEEEETLEQLALILNQKLTSVLMKFPDSIRNTLSPKNDVSDKFRNAEIEDGDPEVSNNSSFERGLRITIREIENLDGKLENSIRSNNSLTSKKKNLKEKYNTLSIIKMDSSTYNQRIDSLHKSNQKIEEFYIKQLFNSGIYDVKISSIQFEFNSGFIENMLVMAEPTFHFSNSIQYKNLPKGLPNTIKFTNQYPLGFSAKRDINALKYATLISIVDEKTEFSLNFRDVVSNVEELLILDRTDYSPLNSSIKINPNNTPEKEFYKDKSTEILQAKIFSDLSGINGEKPNGLIQFEVDKEIPLVTKRYGKSDIIAPFRWLIPKKNNVGFFNYIKPEFVLSKIESNLKDLVLSRSNSETLYASTLDIRQFEKVSVGADMNLAFMDMPFAKSTLYTNAGIRFGRTDLSVSDTLQNNTKSFTNTFQFNPEFGYRINGDERYGLDFNYSPNFIISDERGFKQIGDTYLLQNDQQIHEQNKLHRITLTAYFNFNPGTKGRFFFRFRSFHQWDKWSNNFSQYQLGYSTFLTR